MLELAPQTAALDGKEAQLLDHLRGLERVVVAYSGGVDSAYLAWAAQRALGEKASAFTAKSASLMMAELYSASRLAETIGISHHVVETREIDRPGYVQNSTDRCYHCKSELFDATSLAAKHFQDAIVLDGFNADDLKDFRPGHRAAAEHQVQHPLAEVLLSKAEIRTLSKRAGLPTWNKPQLACLSSRLPYGMEVTEIRLGQVEAVEMALREQGFFDVRARLVKENPQMVRLEVGEAEIERVIVKEVRQQLIQRAKDVGFRFVTLDLEGFRSGRMNEGLNLAKTKLPIV